LQSAKVGEKHATAASGYLSLVPTKKYPLGSKASRRPGHPVRRPRGFSRREETPVGGSRPAPTSSGSAHALHYPGRTGAGSGEPMSTVNINRGDTPAPAGSASETCALERLPHIIKKMCLLWAHPEFESFSSHLLMDSRDGQRAGLPWDVAEEILFLAELRVVKRAIVASDLTGQPFWETYQKMLANAEAEHQRQQAAAWNDPLSNTDIGRLKSGKSALDRPSGSGKSGPTSMSGKSGPTSVSSARPKKKSWLGRLLG